MAETLSLKAWAKELRVKFHLRRLSYCGRHIWGISESNVIWHFSRRTRDGVERTIAVPEEAFPRSARCPIRWLYDKSIPVTNQAWRDKVRQTMKDIQTGALAVLLSGAVTLVTKKDPPRNALGPEGPFEIRRAEIDRLVYEYEWFDVESSNLDAVRFKGSNLDVRFKNGTVYRYSNVPREVLIELLNAKSVGSAFHKLIKSANYPYEKL